MIISPKKTFAGYEILIEDEPANDAIKDLQKAGTLLRGEITPFYKPVNPEEEEKLMPQQDIIKASICFERTRKQVREALRAIVAFVFDSYQIKQKNGLDVGSGATGEMVEELLPKNIDRANWMQMDINPQAVLENKKRHPLNADKIITGSYLSLDKLNCQGIFDTITGLSSLDATQFMEQAIKQIALSLKKDGVFFHMQDVRPGNGVGFRAMLKEGKSFPLPAYFLPHNNEPVLYESQGKLVNTGELFRREIGEKINQNPDFELLINKWITAKKQITDGSRLGRLYFLNMLFGTSNRDDEASAIVTVARKK